MENRVNERPVFVLMPCRSSSVSVMVRESYCKNFADPRFRNREKNGSGAADSAQPETAKSRGNKTEWNKTEGSEPDPFSSDAEDEPDECTRLEAYFMQSLEVDLLLRVCPDEEDTIDQIVNLLVHTCSSKRRMLRERIPL